MIKKHGGGGTVVYKASLAQNTNFPGWPAVAAGQNIGAMFALLKGWLGEKATSLGMWLSLDKNTYHRIDNLILETRTGTTQIDHVVVSRFGVFVVEVKNMKGWVFGDARAAKWTQVIFGRKHQFQNPMRQNYHHTRTVAEELGVDHEDTVGIVFFIGECEFKTAMPEGVFTHGVCGYIRQFSRVRFSDEEVAGFAAHLRNTKRHTLHTNATHVRSLRERFASDTQCPKCGEALVERVAKRGPNAGGSFLGCYGYPRCKFTKGLT